MFSKLKNAVPMCDLESAKREIELATQKNNDLQARNVKLIEQTRELKKKGRLYAHSEDTINLLKEEITMLEEEFDIVKRRLEMRDSSYRWENAIFQKIANLLKRLNISPLQAFEEFDDNKDGILSKFEF